MSAILAKWIWNLTKFTSILVDVSDINNDDAIQDAIVGLAWLGLIEDTYSIGQRSSNIFLQDSPFSETIRVQPALRGLELYGWSQGLPGLAAGEFATKAVVFDTEPSIPRPAQVRFIKELQADGRET